MKYMRCWKRNKIVKYYFIKSFLFIVNKFNDVKDTFNKAKFRLSENISKCEALIEEKNKLKGEEKKIIYTKNKIKMRIEELIKEIDEGILNLEKELKSQEKKKNKFYDLKEKREIYNLFIQKIKLLKSKYNGEYIDEDEINDNRTALEKVENLINEEKNSMDIQRDMYDEEIQKIDEWKKREEVQDSALEEIREGVKELGREAKNAGEGIKEVGIKVKKINPKVIKLENRMKGQTERLKELINKIRSSDKICCDIALILILFGLICVLYSIIKNKYW